MAVNLGGRDALSTYREIDGFQADPQKAYRVVDVHALKSYAETGSILDTRAGAENLPVCWYKGAFCLKYGKHGGKYIIESELDDKFQILADTRSSVMQTDSDIKFVISQNGAVPISQCNVAKLELTFDKGKQKKLWKLDTLYNGQDVINEFNRKREQTNRQKSSEFSL